MLECIGYSTNFAGGITHHIEIDGATAKVDGQPYVVQETNARYILYGPVGKWQPGSTGLPPEQISLNRITGGYLIRDSDDRVLDLSRPEDPGCRKATQYSDAISN